MLLQVPQGAIPVLNGQNTRGVPVDLKPFDTTTIEYYFYFPLPGPFDHFPVHVAKNEQLLASAPAVKLQAVEQLTKIDRKAWQFVSQNGTNEEVLDFLKTENLQRIDLEMIAFRMQDGAFFRGHESAGLAPRLPSDVVVILHPAQCAGAGSGVPGTCQ